VTYNTCNVKDINGGHFYHAVVEVALLSIDANTADYIMRLRICADGQRQSHIYEIREAAVIL
jgi:hypothetical protein